MYINIIKNNNIIKAKNEIKDMDIINIISLIIFKIFFITLSIIDNTFYTFFHYHKNKGHYDLYFFLW